MILDFKKLLETRSYRVKGIDIHPSEPHLVTSLFTGAIQVVNFETSQLLRTVDVSTSPVRAVRYIARKNWIITGGDDMQVRVFNASTLEKITQFEAHDDYIRFIVVHPTLPIVLTTGDDMVIKSWNWEKNWECTQIFRGHTSYVLGLDINPKDPTQFASASMDRTVKVWSLDSNVANYTLVAHDERGVNYVEYYPFADKPYLLTTSDDKTIKILDYQSKNVVATLSGHTHNVSFAVWHPELPLIISGSEDSTLKVWNSRTYKLEQTLNWSMERAWCVATRAALNMVAIGFETGALALRIGRDEPVISMDHSGKLIWVRHLEAFSATVRGTGVEDSELHLQKKDLGSIEMQPTKLAHSPDGKYAAIVGDGEYVVYTALAWRQKHFGSAIDFCWSADSSFAVLTRTECVVKKNFKDRFTIPVPDRNRIFGGHYLALASANDVDFYDWESGEKFATICVKATQIEWANDGSLVCIVTDDSAFVLSVDNEAIESGIANGELAKENAFTEVVELNKEPIRSVTWVGDCMVYTTSSYRLNYLVGTQSYNISHYDRAMFILRYLSRDNAIYLCDKDVKVISHSLSVSVVEFQTAVLRGDVDNAVKEILPMIPESELTSVARFLDVEGYKEIAFDTTRDANHKFELALALGRLDLASQSIEEGETSKWRQLGDSLMAHWNVDGAIKAYEHAKDLDTLLLIYSSTQDVEGLSKVAAAAEAQGAYNVSFNARWAAGDSKGALELLNKTGRHSEAALFALTYGLPTLESVKQWKATLEADGRQNIAGLICEEEETPKTAEDSESTPEKTENENDNENEDENQNAADAADETENKTDTQDEPEEEDVAKSTEESGDQATAE